MTPQRMDGMEWWWFDGAFQGMPAQHFHTKLVPVEFSNRLYRRFEAWSNSPPMEAAATSVTQNRMGEVSATAMVYDDGTLCCFFFLLSRLDRESYRLLLTLMVHNRLPILMFSVDALLGWLISLTRSEGIRATLFFLFIYIFGWFFSTIILKVNLAIYANFVRSWLISFYGKSINLSYVFTLYFLKNFMVGYTV